MLTSGDEIEDWVRTPGEYSITEIKVLRASGNLPVNLQVGPTCGIYALDAAFQIRGTKFAPRKRVFGDWRAQGIPRHGSMRGFAKQKGLTQIGEIGGVLDLHALAAGLGIEVRVVRFESEAELWNIVRTEMSAGHSIVMPYACADDDGTPAWSMDSSGFAHWCLLFGYARTHHSGNSFKWIFMTTYGQYHKISPYRVFQSNQRIQDWPRQSWIKLTFWWKDFGGPWKIWKSDWCAEATVVSRIKGMAAATEPGVGFGIGDSTQVLHKVLDPSRTAPNFAFETALQQAISKRADLKAVEYTKTFRGQCVIV